MDLDALVPKKLGATDFTQEDLSSFSIEELRDRVTALEGEIKRCKDLMDAKEGTRQAADSLFKT